MKRTTKILQGVPPRSFFSTPVSLQNQSQLLIVQQKNKTLPEGGQQLNTKNDTDKDRVLIHSQVEYRTQYNSETR